MIFPFKSLLLAALICCSPVPPIHTDTVHVRTDTIAIIDSISNDTILDRPFKLRDFLNKMANMESGNKHTAVNRFGFLGKYQFHLSTIAQLGVKTTRTKFLRNPALQDTVMLMYMDQNRSELSRYIKQYAGKKFNGIHVTESGIIAAGHLAGSPKVARYFKTGRDIRDANGASISMYMKKFGGYSLTNN